MFFITQRSIIHLSHRCDDAHANLGDELDADARGAVGRLEVMNQLR